MWNIFCLKFFDDCALDRILRILYISSQSLTTLINNRYYRTISCWLSHRHRTLPRRFHPWIKPWNPVSPGSRDWIVIAWWVLVNMAVPTNFLHVLNLTIRFFLLDMCFPTLLTIIARNSLEIAPWLEGSLLKSCDTSNQWMPIVAECSAVALNKTGKAL